MYAWRPLAICFFTNSITSGSFSCLTHYRGDRSAIGRLFPEERNIQVAVNGLRERARDRRRGHDEDVRGIAPGDQTRSLQHAELMLLIDHNKAEIVESARFIKKRMRADNDLGSIRVPSGVLAGVPPSRVFRRDAGNCTRGRVRSPILCATWKPNPGIVLVCAYHARVPWIASYVMKLLLQVLLGADQPVKRFLFPNWSCFASNSVDLVGRKRLQGVEYFGEGKEDCGSVRILLLDRRFHEEMHVVRHHADGVKREAYTLM